MLNEKANFLLLKTRRKKIYLYELFKKKSYNCKLKFVFYD